LLRPADLQSIRPYRWAAIAVVLLALSPLLAFGDNLVRPLAKSQYVARSAGGLVIVAIVLFVWAYKSGIRERLKALVMLRDPANARRFLAFALLIVLANVPSDVFLTSTWIDYTRALRQTVTTHSGVVAIEDTPLAHRPHILFVEYWTLPSQSLAFRSKPGDGIVAPPRDFHDWIPFPPEKAPDLGRFNWRD